MSIAGFIGTGSMGSALARAAGKGGGFDTLLLANRTRDKAERLALELGGRAVDNAEAAAAADVLFLGVEPAELPEVIAGLRPVLDERESPPLVVSMAAGVELAALERMLGDGVPVVRIMPNIPAAVGAGVILWCASATVSQAQIDTFLAAMAPAGSLSRLPEEKMKAATGVTGCGPAFAALFAEALADGAVACGLPRSQAREYAAQTLLGSARLLLEEGISPAELKDRVCSPGGSTIQGVRALEKGGFRSAVTEAVIAAFEKKF